MRRKLEIGDVVRQRGNMTVWLLDREGRIEGQLYATCVARGNGAYQIGFKGMPFTVKPYDDGVEILPPEDWDDELVRRVALLKMGITEEGE